MVVPQNNSVPSERESAAIGRDSGLAIVPNPTRSQDEALVLSTLKKAVAAGEHRLDPMLAAIAEAAVRLTGASGAALAMWKDGAMACRARSGETAPPLGAQLSAETGISGACLRTGKTQHCPDTENNPLVDAEVCRRLGLRSIAALPIQGWRGVNGILEVFSTAPEAFTEHHLAALEQLAALAERARASQPHGASQVVTTLPVEKPEPSGLLPASDRVGDVALALMGRRSRLLVFGTIGLASILLVGFVIWLGWRGHDDNDGKAHAASPSSATIVTASSIGTRLPDNDPIWKPNPGGQALLPSGGKPAAGTPMTLASRVEAAPGKNPAGDRSLLAADAVSIALPQRAPGSDATADGNSAGAPRSEEANPVEPPPIAIDQLNSSALLPNGVLSAQAVLPGYSAPVSQGISGGQLLHRVPPVYPAQARMLRLEGKVILDAMVMEDGSVRDLKVVQGHPALAQAAVEAVRQWRYQPYTLDGKPVKRETTITFDFNGPQPRGD